MHPPVPSPWGFAATAPPLRQSSIPALSAIIGGGVAGLYAGMQLGDKAVVLELSLIHI